MQAGSDEVALIYHKVLVLSCWAHTHTRMCTRTHTLDCDLSIHNTLSKSYNLTDEDDGCMHHGNKAVARISVL